MAHLAPIRPFSKKPLRFWRLLWFFVLFSVGCQTDTAVPPTPISNTVDPFQIADATPTLSANTDEVSRTVNSLPTAIIPTVTPFPTITSTPMPEERVAFGQEESSNGNFEAAITHFETGLQSGVLTDDQTVDSQFGLAVAFFEEGQYEEAIAIFEGLLEETAVPSQITFYLAQSHAALADWQAALDTYSQFLETTPILTAYVAPLMAVAHFALGNIEEAVQLLETAVSAPAHRLTEFENRQRLIAHHQADNDLPASVIQYDAIHDLARTEFTKGEMTYLAGFTELQQGNAEAAFERFGFGLVNYPRAYESYLGLVQLVDNGVPVNEYQRGLVNYHAGSYEPCAAAFERYIAGAPELLLESAYLFQAYCYEGLGDLTAASISLEAYALTNPANGLAESGWMWARAGLIEEAELAFLDYVSQFPDGEQVVDLLWQTAVYANNRNDKELAIERFVALADSYGWHKDAPEALFRAGYIAHQSGDLTTAVQLWDRAAVDYPDWNYGAAATVWLLKTLPDVSQPISVTTQAALVETIELNTAVDFYALRAEALASGQMEFKEDAPFELPPEIQIAQDQKEAELWLDSWLDLETVENTSTLSPELANDPHLLRGEALWQIGLLELAKRELEAVRITYADNPLASYQLALYFRDLGLYRSSIGAATAVLNQSGQSIREVPRFLGQLIYPIYYADLILPLADAYGYDPRLQFALVRQESLFESFARSGAAAQGLSQVIPDTGAYIATQLNWPDFENDDLYKPYVGLNFGAFYLAQQLGFFDNNVHAALAAYNAGPGNAARWYETAGSDIDLYYQTVNFRETRSYIERIYVGYEMYRFLYGE